MKNVYELFFILKNKSNWSFLEMYNLPIALRKWFVEKYIELAKEQNEKNN
jgi:hypothetical protein